MFASLRKIIKYHNNISIIEYLKKIPSNSTFLFEIYMTALAVYQRKYIHPRCVGDRVHGRPEYDSHQARGPQTGHRHH